MMQHIPAIRRILIVKSTSNDPFFNLALEDYLFDQLAADPTIQAVLYLWQNQNTVVIGRNQNAWQECKTALLEEEGGHLARRTTGGGAVFHDLGNLNFSLLLPEKAFNIERNFQMIVETVRRAGIPAEKSGRNDLLADGQKFSGNAFRINRGVGLHHGTLLIHSAFERVGRYLTVAPSKLAAKGVQSVRSRVTNLARFRPDLDVFYWMRELEAVFTESYNPASNLKIESLSSSGFAQDPALTARVERFASWDWRFGEAIAFDAEIETQTSWGHVHLGFQIQAGHVAGIRLFSDALDSDFVAILEQQLMGLPFASQAISTQLRAHEADQSGYGVSRGQMAVDLAALIDEQGW